MYFESAVVGFKVQAHQSAHNLSQSNQMKPILSVSTTTTDTPPEHLLNTAQLHMQIEHNLIDIKFLFYRVHPAKYTALLVQRLRIYHFLLWPFWPR